MNIKAVTFKWNGNDLKKEVDVDTLGPERDHMERTFSERFNFFLLWVALISAAAFVLDSSHCALARATLFFGGLISLLMLRVIWRTKTKLWYVLSMLRAAYPNHAAKLDGEVPGEWLPTWISKHEAWAKQHNKLVSTLEWIHRRLTITELLGVTVPMLCCLALFAGAYFL